MTPRRDQRGSALVELTWLGVLLLVPLLWIVVGVFEVQRGAFAVSSAARAAGRAYALAPNDAVGQSRAETVVRQALVDQGLDDAPVRVSVTCAPYPADCHSGTSVITFRVYSSVQIPMLPDVPAGFLDLLALGLSERPRELHALGRWLRAMTSESHEWPGEFSVLSVSATPRTPARVSLYLRPAEFEVPRRLSETRPMNGMALV